MANISYTGPNNPLAEGQASYQAYLQQLQMQQQQAEYEAQQQQGGNPLAAALLGNTLGGGGSAPAAPSIASATSGFLPEAPSMVGVGGGLGPETPNIVSVAPTGGPFSLSGIGSAGNAYLPIAGAIGAGDLLLNQDDKNYSEPRSALQGAASGAAVGSYFGPVGAAIGGGVGGLGGFLGAKFGSGKGKLQRERDEIRANLVGKGLIDKTGNLTLSDGTVINIGRDVKSNLADGRLPFEVDMNSADVGDLIAAVNPLATIISGGSDKAKTAFAGSFVNELQRIGGDPTERIRQVYQALGLDQQTAVQSILDLYSQGKIDENTAQIMGHDINYLYDQGSRYNPGSPNNTPGYSQPSVAPAPAPKPVAAPQAQVSAPPQIQPQQAPKPRNVVSLPAATRKPGLMAQRMYR